MSSYQKHTDAELMELLKGSDDKAFDEIYTRYESALAAYAIQITRQSEEAADIVQEVFVSLWKRRETLQITYSVKAWLYKAIRFQTAKYIEQNIRKHHFLEGLALFIDGNHTSSPDIILENDELFRKLEQVVNAMPEKMRIVYLLSREEQLSHREISHRLNIAESTVKKHIQNALKLIKAEIPAYSAIIWLFIDQVLF